nr:hypothetical protein GCM10020093_048870 [Planobispora longispora]
MHDPHPRALAAQGSADVHQAGVVGGAEHLGAGGHDVVHLVGAHGGGDGRVLDGEGAAEAAALLRARERDQLQAPDAPQQPGGAVAEMEPAQGVAGRVVDHPVREGGADVGHPEDVDQELRQVVDLRRRLRHRLGEGRPRRGAGQPGYCSRTMAAQDPEG